jgi:leucyl-tRNA synthetase
MKPERYNAKEPSRNGRPRGTERALFVTDDDDPRPKYYVLEMFPTRRAHPHGHVRNYTMGDVVARYKRARASTSSTRWGGTPSACRPRTPPCRTRSTPRNGPTPTSPRCGRSSNRWGLSLDWSREIATCDPSYYRHQQRLFLDFLKAGLVDRKTAMVNWDPVDQTVLANEQVIDGHGWRSGAPVEQRELTQWFFRITHYAQDLWTSSTRSSAGRKKSG